MYYKFPAINETWSKNGYPIKDKEKLLETFSLSIKNIYSNPESKTVISYAESHAKLKKRNY